MIRGKLFQKKWWQFVGDFNVGLEAKLMLSCRWQLELGKIGVDGSKAWMT